MKRLALLAIVIAAIFLIGCTTLKVTRYPDGRVEGVYKYQFQRKSQEIHIRPDGSLDVKATTDAKDAVDAFQAGTVLGAQFAGTAVKAALK